MAFPVIDLHCDLLYYLAHIPGASVRNTDIGSSLPFLQQGNVALQVMAIFTMTQPGSTDSAILQTQKFRDLLTEADVHPVTDIHDLENFPSKNSVGVVAAIENASGLLEEDEPRNLLAERLEFIRKATGRVLYLTMTHHTENRFGGGNFSGNIGLKPDGEFLLDYLADTEICIDMSHTSDALAHDILTYISKQNLNIPVIASHSNFRPVWDHLRNLPDEITREVIQRQGLIGINFLRNFVDANSPETLMDHIAYGVSSGAEENLAFGADFFYTHDFPDKNRFPLFSPELENASKYPEVLEKLKSRIHLPGFPEKISHANALLFLKQIWRER